LDPSKPYAYLAEKERTASGTIEDVATIFLTNKECPFKCLMCDLWKNTIDENSVPGMIPGQIVWALEKLPAARHIKLYNSGNFFDQKAIPVEDYRRIAFLLQDFKTVIIECHPKLINDRCLEFRDMLKPDLEIALGLETVHPKVLEKLNKRMTLDDFRNSVEFLTKNDISTRAFTLLRPPFLTEEEGIYWEKRTLDFAFEIGIGCCVVIPTRAGNGVMDQLQEQGFFTPPHISSMEEVLEYGINLGAGRVFADLWDLQLFSSCQNCFDDRQQRLQSMNLHQLVYPPVQCDCQIH
jgi:radical SAM enzyme (TIGR01210 family)